MNTVDGVIRHGRVLTCDYADPMIEDGAIAFDGGLIVAVGSTEAIDQVYRGRTSIDAQGAVVRPGFIDAHIHISQYTARSALPYLAAFSLNMGHWKGQLRPEDEKASALLAACDYLLCGYTGFVDPGTIFEPDAVATVADEIGVRIWLTDPYVADRGRQLAHTSPELVSSNFLSRWPSNLDEAVSRIGKQLSRNRKGGLVRAFVGIYGETTESAELRFAAIKVARENNVQFQMHLGYTPEGYRQQTAEVGCTPLQDIARQSGIDSGQTYTHLNWMDDADCALVLKNGPALVWCPYGTLQMLAGGHARNRMAEIARDGGVVALATDIPRIVNFDGIAGIALSCAAALGQPLTPENLLAMRTTHAAKSVGASHLCGRLAEGLSADLVVEMPHQLDVAPFFEVAALSGRCTVRHVFVAGQHVVSEGTLKNVDVERIRMQARKSVDSLIGRIDAS